MFCVAVGNLPKAMVLNAGGVSVTPESIVDQVYIPSRKGSLQIEMMAATRRNDLVAYELSPALTDLLLEISANTHVVVLENYRYGLHSVWHYAVTVGYDLNTGRILRRSGMHKRESMPFASFEYLWKADEHWAMIALPPDRIPATASETRYASAVVALEKTGQIKSA